MKQAHHRSKAYLWSCSLIAFLAGGCLWLTAAARAAPPQDDIEVGDQRQAPSQTSAREAPGATATLPGLRVYIDPETGEITSTPSTQQKQALSHLLADALSRSPEGLRFFDLPGGGKGVYLEGRFQHALTVRVKADGTLEAGCADHLHQAEAFLNQNDRDRDERARQ